MVSGVSFLAMGLVLVFCSLLLPCVSFLCLYVDLSLCSFLGFLFCSVLCSLTVVFYVGLSGWVGCSLGTLALFPGYILWLLMGRAARSIFWDIFRTLGSDVAPSDVVSPSP